MPDTKTSDETDHNIGVLNPFALVEIKLKRRIDWTAVAEHQQFIENILGFPYANLFDPQHGSPLYPNLRYDLKQKALVHDPTIPTVSALLSQLKLNDAIALRAGAPRLTRQEWVDPGHFFNLNPADFTDPIQGGVPDCHFISALASLAWANPYTIAQRTRPIRDPDTFTEGNAVDLIQFYPEAGAISQNIEVTELLPLIEPGQVYLYARSADLQQTWPAIYEKAWVKWFTKDPSDKPDYTKIKGGNPVDDLVALTSLNPTRKQTQPLTADAIFDDVRANCHGSWTFNPMVAWTYASAAAAPTPIN